MVKMQKAYGRRDLSNAMKYIAGKLKAPLTYSELLLSENDFEYVLPEDVSEHIKLAGTKSPCV